MRRQLLVRLTVCLIVMLCTAWKETSAQTPGCDTADGQAFDFWVGEWELTWPAGQGGVSEGEKGRGTNLITKVLEDCVIQEQFSSETGFRGMSLSVYHRPSGEWRQTWVDSNGGYLTFRGGLRDGIMDLRTEAFANAEGQQQINRMIWRNVTENSLIWHWQKSLDDGHSWDDLWVITYKRAPQE